MPASDKPNVLLISADHWPASAMGVSGHPAVQTPTLDQLAGIGARFTNAYSECPVCGPARRTLMTGTTSRTHGMLTNKGSMRMPDVPTLAQTFRNAGYQAYGVGKLHVFPSRDRIGFDDVILDEEGRVEQGLDDYELFLGDQGYAGQHFAHGMSNNHYHSRPWHLPEHTHVTHWATQQMARTISRRDPTRPGFWYLAYSHPHPPLVPLGCYLDMYRDIDPGLPFVGEWARGLNFAQHPARDEAIRAARRAFYALITHIDHQIRVVIGTLREAGLLDNTIILFTTDHGDMLGNHNLWAKTWFYEDSTCVPMILVPAKGDKRVGIGRTDDRLVGLQDVMPTLLDLAGIDIPVSVDGLSMAGQKRRPWLYGEFGAGPDTGHRMIHDGRFKLIYHAAGNRRQLFDLQEDPREMRDLAESPEHTEMLDRLTKLLIEQLHGAACQWVRDGVLIGSPIQDAPKPLDRGLNNQRGTHWPPPHRSR